MKTGQRRDPRGMRLNLLLLVSLKHGDVAVELQSFSLHLSLFLAYCQHENVSCSASSEDICLFLITNA
jgi:hypothetical protein